MIYYRVKPEFDNFKMSKKYEIFVGNELFTSSELEKIYIKWINRNNLNRYNKKQSTFEESEKFLLMFEKVEIPKNKTYWFFGARFQRKR